VLHDKLFAEQTLVQVSQFAPGIYSLTRNYQTQNLKTFKLVKTTLKMQTNTSYGVLGTVSVISFFHFDQEDE